MNKKVACSECGSSDAVETATSWWTAWGHNCFDFNWQQTPAEPLCESCENEWAYCAKCGSLVDREHYGAGYPKGDDFPDESECPGCIEKRGIALTVKVYLIKDKTK